MKQFNVTFSFILIGLCISFATFGQQNDTLRYKIDDALSDQNLSNLDFSNSIQRDIRYNPTTGDYNIITKIGEVIIDEHTMSPEDYRDYIQQKNIQQYWRERVNFDMDNARGAQQPDLSKYIDTTNIPFLDVNPFGNFDVIMGVRTQNVQNPTIPIRQRKTGGMDFDMNIQMGISGSIADRLNFDATYNTETNFNFNRNQFVVGYEGKEDDILKKIEFGNVSLPLRSSLIQGNQSLLGVKSTLQFGRLTATAVLSQQESKQQGITLEGGSQRRDFEIKADEYEENRHFFLSHYFRDQYESNLQTLPALNTPYNITRLQVWITNRSFQTTNIREFIAFTDLGEPDRIYNPLVIPQGSGSFTDNGANSLYRTLVNSGNDVRRPETAPGFLRSNGFQETTDYEIITARKLQESEYNFNKDLGYISLNRSLAPDEVLAIAFEYTDLQGNVRRVGEFSESLGLGTNQSTNTSRDQLLVLKLLKPKAPRTDLPTWDLMMKNIYPLGAYQVNQNDFRLDIYYNDPGDGLKRYLPVEDTEPTISAIPLIRLLQLDRFNASTIPRPDGVFDFIPRYTIDPTTGRLIFPVLEPFGDHLRDILQNNDNEEVLVYDELYDLTKTQAQQFPEYNRYSITGSYKTNVRDDISLGAFNIPRGSVTVRAGGRSLIENVDYTIDYNLGRIKVINPALMQSGVPLNVQFENNLQFGFQSKRLAGTRLDYYVNEKLGLGATLMNLRERPFSNKVNLGDDPINNSVIGVDVNFQSDSPWLTRLVDNIPLINTKEASSINIQAEFARFMPGHSKQIGKNNAGQVYIDDFEGASSSYDLKFPPQNWVLSSTPKRFPEADSINSLANSYRRAKIAWYNIDPILNSTNNRSDRPANIDPQARSDVYGRQVLEREVFPNIVNEQRVTLPLVTLDVSYYPNERGPYNFSVNRLNSDGTLQDPEENWGGIMREINVTDFQAANVEFIEFWLMDPFIDTDNRPSNSTNKGKLVFNLGNISEDILKDGRKFFENGLPEPNQAPNLDQTVWGNIPTVLNINNAFAASEDALRAQDIGFDGLNNEEEQSFFNSYLQQIAAVYGTNSLAYQAALNDPSADDFHHFLGDDYDQENLGIVDRYKHFNNPHGNSSGTINNSGNFSYNSSNVPDSEDVNRDNTLERTEAYYEYEIDLSRNDLRVGENFIVSKVETLVDLPNGQTKQVDWYQFKVPIDGYSDVINNMQGFQSIRFMRMFLTDFEQPTTLRFARLNLLRNQWRRYQYSFYDRTQPVNNQVSFNVFPVNIEENQNKQPFPYVLPPGIQREEIQGAANSFLRNEQSLALNICQLPENDVRAIYKLTNLDLRLFDQLKMFVHAESVPGELDLDNDDIELLVRIGSDFTDNFYEYRQPLDITPYGATDAFSIWPENNNVDITIQDWIQLKKERNSDINAPTNQIYYNDDGNLGVIGTPDLGRSAFIMIGVRNRVDDKRSKCVEVWINELRVSGINEQPGYAALARADFQLADFGNISLNGNMHSAGYGNLEQRVQDRYRDDYVEFDISGDFDLDKFLPASSTVRLPVFASFSKTTSLPQYNPYETDIKLKEEPDSIQNLLREEVEIKTINFTNIRKERKQNERTPKVYDIENFNLSYSYTERNVQTPIIAEEQDKTHFGALSYNFNPEPKPVRPFFRIIQDQKYLQWLKDVNLNLVPTKLSFRTDMTNRWQQSALRDLQQPSESLEPYFFKDWIWNRNYDLIWDLTNSIRIDFNAQNQSRIDQPDGYIDTQQERDSIWNNVKTFGRNVLYNHSADVSYDVPFDKIPILDFIKLDANYGTNYQWLSAPQEIDPQTGKIRLNTLGNAIRNTQELQLNSTLNFSELYNKSGFLKQYNDASSDTRSRPRTRTRPTNNDDQDSKPDDKKQGRKQRTVGKGLGIIMKPLLSLKRLSLNYSDQRGTLVPGFLPKPTSFGLDMGNNSPGWDFVFGYQPDREWLNEAAAQNWITKDTTFSYQFNQSRTRQFSADASLQPIKNFVIDVNLDYSKTNDYNELFRNIGSISNPQFAHVNPYYSGAYDISFISFQTLFAGTNSDGIPSVFRDFEDNRIEASALLQARNPNSTGVYPEDPDYRQGYGPYSQEVLMPAFVAAYTGKPVSDVKLNPFNTTPLPNWKLSYSGLTDIPLIAKTFRSIRLNHSYSGSFTINQFNSNLKYQGPEDYFLPTAIDTLSYNYYAYYYIPQVTITERFSPLAGIDFTVNNGLTGRFNFAKSRTVGFGVLDYQLSERNSSSFTIGMGYQTKNFKLPFRLFGKSKELENDLRFQLDYSLDDQVVTNYKLDQDTSLPTRGAKTISIQPTIDYAINQRMNLQLYLDRRKSEPKTRNSYPISNTRSGVKISYNFGR